MSRLNLHARVNWLKAALYLLLLGALLWLGWRAAARMVASIDYRNSDFFTFYLAGWMNWQAQDPYSIKQWIAGHDQFGVTWIPNSIFPYPLPLATLLAPLGLLSLYDSFVVWVFTSGLLVLVTCAWLLAQEKTPHYYAYALPLLIGAILFRPTLVTFHDGQLGALWLFLIGCTAVLWSRGNWFIGGLSLGMLALKPSLGLPLLALVGLWLVFRRRVTALAGLAVCGFGLGLIGYLRDSNWPGDFLKTSNQKLSGVFGASPSLWGFSGAICQYQERCTWALGGLVVVFFVGLMITYLWAMRDKMEPLLVLGIASAAAVLITPYIWAYDQILVLVTVIAAMIMAIRTGAPYLITASYPILLAALSAVLVLVALQLGRDHWSVWVPLVCLAALMVVLRRQRLSPPSHP